MVTFHSGGDVVDMPVRTVLHAVVTMWSNKDTTRVQDEDGKVAKFKLSCCWGHVVRAVIGVSCTDSAGFVAEGLYVY